MRDREQAFPVEGEFALPFAAQSPHLWKASLPRGMPVGTYWIEVKSTDMFGQVDHGRRVIRIVEATEQTLPAK